MLINVDSSQQALVLHGDVNIILKNTHRGII